MGEAAVLCAIARAVWCFRPALLALIEPVCAATVEVIAEEVLADAVVV
jgi:hypothetical protein